MTEYNAEQISKLAEFSHEVNKLYCEMFMNDYSQPAWENAPEWQRKSAINGVMFHLQNVASPEQSHESWMKEKLADGWKYGEVKDPEKKEHPCMVPYLELPVGQRIKDSLFSMSVKSLRPLIEE